MSPRVLRESDFAHMHEEVPELPPVEEPRHFAPFRVTVDETRYGKFYIFFEKQRNVLGLKWFGPYYGTVEIPFVYPSGPEKGQEYFVSIHGEWETDTLEEAWAFAEKYVTLHRSNSKREFHHETRIL